MRRYRYYKNKFRWFVVQQNRFSPFSSRLDGISMDGMYFVYPITDYSINCRELVPFNIRYKFKVDII